MATTRKSTKRAGKKRSGAKRASARKRSTRKAASRRGTKATKRGARKATLKRRAKKGLRVAREGLDTVRQAGERTWDVLKSTTSQVVEGVKERFGEDSTTDGGYGQDRYSR
jgi:hypothetical protein